jgi:purine-binding chemotaxis protein CheW
MKDKPEERRKVLKARAKALAQEPKKEGLAFKEQVEIVEFLLAYERYGIELRFVREVYPLKDLTPLPVTPPFVLGMINVRGQILSVIDIKRFFDLPEKGLTDLNKVIILHNDGMEFGILADVIIGANRIPLSDIQTSLPTLVGIREEYLKGVTRERLVILDAEKLLRDKRLIVQEEGEA